MLDILCPLIIFFGVYGFIISLISLDGNLELLTERDNTCPERFITKQKWCDGLCAFHDLSKAIVGASFVLCGILCYKTTYIIDLWSIVSFVFMILLLDSSISTLMFKYKGLKKLMYEIEEQWDKEKHITKEHDDEVRYYRQAKIVSQILKYDGIYFSLLLFVSLII